MKQSVIVAYKVYRAFITMCLVQNDFKMYVQTLAGSVWDAEGSNVHCMFVFMCANIDSVLCEWSIIQHPVLARDTRGSQTNGMCLITVHSQVHNIKIIALTPMSNKNLIHCICDNSQTFQS